MKTKIRSSMDSIDRVGAKLSYSDFKEYLKQVANAFPSGTEEYTFLQDLLTGAKTDTAFAKKLFGLLGEEPKISEASPYGFSWELLAPTDLGKAVFKKFEELDETSAHDLYEFLSYVQLNYQGADDMYAEPEEGFEEEAPVIEAEPKADLVVEPEDIADATEKKPLSASAKPIKSSEGGPADKVEAHFGVDESFRLYDALGIDRAYLSDPEAIYLLGFNSVEEAMAQLQKDGKVHGPVYESKGVTVFKADKFALFQTHFPGAFGLTEPDFNRIVSQGGPTYVFVKEGKKFSWHSQAGFVSASDKDMTLAEAVAILSADAVAAVTTDVPDLRLPFTKDPSGIKPVLPGDRRKELKQSAVFDEGEPELDEDGNPIVPVTSKFGRKPKDYTSKEWKKAHETDPSFMTDKQKADQYFANLSFYGVGNPNEGYEGQGTNTVSIKRPNGTIEHSDFPTMEEALDYANSLMDMKVPVSVNYVPGNGTLEHVAGVAYEELKEIDPENFSRWNENTVLRLEEVTSSGPAGPIVSLKVRKATMPRMNLKRKPGPSEGSKVTVKHDILISLDKGTQGSVVGIPEAGFLMVRFEGDEDIFDNPITVKDTDVSVIDINIDSAFGGRAPITVGTAIELRKNVNLEIRKGTTGLVVGFEDSQHIIVDFGKRRGVPIVGPMSYPVKYFSVKSSAVPIESALPPSPVADYQKMQPAQRLEAMKGVIHAGSIVLAVRKDTGRPASHEVGQVYSFALNPDNIELSKADIIWSDGARTEILMKQISTLLYNSLAQAGAKLAIVSSFREVNGTVSFVLSGLAPSKAINSYKGIFSGKVSLSKEAFIAAKISPKTRLYSGKEMAVLFESLSTLDGSMDAARNYRFGKTFISEKAAVIVQSGPYGMFAVKTPVVFVKGSKNYTLFKKIGDTYLASSGHRFRSIQAAAYGKPSYLMVANSSKAHFTKKGTVTCDAHRFLEKTQFILQRKALRAAVLANQKVARTLLASSKKMESDLVQAKATQETLDTRAVSQASTIAALGQRLIDSGRAPVTLGDSPETERAERMTRNAAVLARRMANL